MDLIGILLHGMGPKWLEGTIYGTYLGVTYIIYTWGKGGDKTVGANFIIQAVCF